jgi:hypothetical protein
VQQAFLQAGGTHKAPARCKRLRLGCCSDSLPGWCW